MKKLYKTLTFVILFSLLAGACQCAAWPWDTSVAPIVVQCTPERGEELPPDGVIQLVFDRAMDKSSVETTLLVGPDVAGGIEWVDAPTANFKPARDLERDTEYTVTLGPEAKAADGEVIGGAYRFRFRTVGYLEVAQIVSGRDLEIY